MRFAELKGRLIVASRQPELLGDHQTPCGTAPPALVAVPWRKLARRGRALRDNDPEEDFHEVRIRAKRVRYAAEAAVPTLDPKTARAAGRMAKAAETLQDLLGEHQDAVTARATIEQLVGPVADGAGDGHLAFRPAADRLIRSQDRAARKARKRFPKVWKTLDRKKRLRWLRN